jgi:hypothetical protein
VELNLDELRIPAISPDIKKILEKAKNLEMLILADNDLENVDNLPKLDLTVLDLSSNKYSSTHPGSPTPLSNASQSSST